MDNQGGAEDSQPEEQKADVSQAQDLNHEQFYELKSEMTWQQIGVPPILEDRLLEMNYKGPSKIQENVIPYSFSKSIFAQSKNGSGKTLSFLVPAILHTVSSQPYLSPSKALMPQVIILADTRALIMQLHKLARNLAECDPNIRIGYSFKGSDKNEDEQQTDYDQGHIVIMTGAKVAEFHKKKKLDLSLLKLFILDEADNVLDLDNKNGSFLASFLERFLPKYTKVIITSATRTSLTEKTVEGLSKDREFHRIEVTKESLTLENVQQFYVVCKKEEVTDILDLMIQTLSVNNILVFANSKKTVSELSNHFGQTGVKSVLVSSNGMSDTLKESEINQYAIASFMRGEYRVLLTTNLLARGIDMRKVNLVLNLELPLKYPKSTAPDQKVAPTGVDPETYLHRVGRTGRFGDRGICINFIYTERDLENLNEISNYYKIKMQEIPTDSLEVLNNILGEIAKFNSIKQEALEENI